MSRRPPPAPSLRPDQRRALEELRRGDRALQDAPPELFDLARRHRVAGTLAQWASERGEPVTGDWRARHLQLNAQRLARRADLDAFVSTLEEMGCPWVAARGWARVYERVLPIRPMGDLDLYTTPEFADLISKRLVSRWRPAHRRAEAVVSGWLLFDRESRLPSLDIHGDLGWFGDRSGYTMALVLERRRSVDGCWLPHPEDDYAIALVEALQAGYQRSLQRWWELEAMRERLSEAQQVEIFARLGLKPTVLARIEADLSRDVPRRPLMLRGAWRWIRSAQSPVGTALWLAPTFARLARQRLPF